MKRLRPTLHAIGSLWFAAILLMLLLVSMASATAFEARHGLERARAEFYGAWWFEGLLWLLGVNTLISLMLRFPYSRKLVGFGLTHVSILIILVGALVTKLWAFEGTIGLAEGQSTSVVSDRGREALVLLRQSNETRTSVDLPPHVFGGFRHVQAPAAPALTHAGATVRVREYLPDSRVRRRITAVDIPRAPAAAQIALSAGEMDGRWIFAGQPRQVDALQILLRRADDAAEIQRWLAATEDPAAAGGRLLVQVEDEEVSVPVSSALAAPVSIRNGAYTLRVLRVLERATVGEGGAITDEPNRAPNPAVEIQINGPSATDRRILFANFPGFRRGDYSLPDVSVRYEAASIAPPRAPIELLADEQRVLYARFAPADNPPQIQPVRQNEPLTTPWPNVQLVVQQYLPHAREIEDVELIVPPRQERTPAIRLQLEAGAEREEVWLRKRQSLVIGLGGERYELAYLNREVPLSFSVTLRDFQLGLYPGGASPRSYQSLVDFRDGATGNVQTKTISMNSPTEHGDYLFFQSGFDQQGGREFSFLSVTRDPGQPIVFLGYVLLMVGTVVVMTTRLLTRRPQPSRNATPPAAAALLLCLTLSAPLAVGASPELPANPDLAPLRSLPVQYDGRYPPLDTLAREVVRSVTGTEAFEGADPLRMLLSWTFSPDRWTDQPLIPITSDALRAELRLPAEREMFSYDELVRHRHLVSLISQLSSRQPGTPLDDLERKVEGIYSQLVQLQQVFSNRAIPLIPDPSSTIAPWRTIGTITAGDPAALQAVQATWRALGDALLADDAAVFAATAERLRDQLVELPAAYRPTPVQLARELRYNALQPFRIGWLLLLGGAVLSLLGAVFTRNALRRRGQPAARASATEGRALVRVLALLATLTGFGIVSYGLWMRGAIADRVPAANMYESLLFLSWGAALFAIAAAIVAAFVPRGQVVAITAGVIAWLSLMLADLLPIDPAIKPVAPVLLDTAWMAIHVPVIMVSYAVLAIAVAVAHAQLVLMALAPGRREMSQRIDLVHYWYVLVGAALLAAGIITGSMWGAYSWGRYWGWDPKEVWSLVALFGYLAILHVRVDQERVIGWTRWAALALTIVVFGLIALSLKPLSLTQLSLLLIAGGVSAFFVFARGAFATALKSVVAFWLIIMTYVGVNYVLGMGLHSYGFGRGAVVRWLFLVGGLDLALILACGLIYVLRRRGASQPVYSVNV